MQLPSAEYKIVKRDNYGQYLALARFTVSVCHKAGRVEVEVPSRWNEHMRNVDVATAIVLNTSYSLKLVTTK